MPVRFHHVQLAIPHGGEADARAFWLDLLGFTEIEKPPVLAARGGLWCRRDGVEVHLGVAENFRPAAKAHPGFLVADLDRVAARMEGAGHPIIRDSLLPGHRRFYVSDPFGNRLEFLEPDS